MKAKRSADFPFHSKDKGLSSSLHGGLENPPSGLAENSGEDRGMSAVRDIEFTQIAAEWDSITLGEENPQTLLVMRNGMTAKQVQDGGEYKVSRIETIGGGWIDEKRVRFTSGLKEKDVEKYRLRKGDILFSHINSDKHLGKTGFAERDYDDLLHGMNLLLIRANPEIFDPEFLNRVFQHYRDIGVFISICSRAVNQSSINQAKMKALELPLPPLPEQKKIAHILSTVQRAIEAQERIIQTTTDLKKALMHKLFSEGLRNEPQKQTEIGPIPASWNPITLSELCEKPDGALQTGPFGSQLHKHEYQEEGIAVVNPTHLAGNRINHENVPRVSEEVAQRLGKHRLRKFDILFARRGEIGRQGLVSEAEETWLCGTGCFLVRASKPFIDNRFLALYFATDRLVKWLYAHAAGAIMPNLNNSVMQRLPVFYPDQETQATIIDTFTTIEQKFSAAVQRKTALQDLFRTLLHELMTANTRVDSIKI